MRRHARSIALPIASAVTRTRRSASVIFNSTDQFGTGSAIGIEQTDPIAGATLEMKGAGPGTRVSQSRDTIETGQRHLAGRPL